MHLVSTFGAPALASSVTEETASTIVRHSPAVSLVSKNQVQIPFPHLEKHRESTLHTPRIVCYKIAFVEGPRNFFFMIQDTCGCNMCSLGPWIASWLEHRTLDRKAWVPCPVPPNTLRVHTVLVKSADPKVLWAVSRVQGTGEYISSPSVPCLNCGGGDRWFHHILSHREFCRAKKSNLSGAQSQRQAYF
ncbi:hypothetical protein TNCV_1100601 [Trichonephila clavipes]|nr:hypothetical protein TNCV_1100601 [Trichonephila clavipes]